MKEFTDPLAKFSFEDILVPPKVDIRLLLMLLLSEFTLVGFSLLIADLFQIKPIIGLNSLIIDQSSILLAAQYTVPLVCKL